MSTNMWQPKKPTEQTNSRKYALSEEPATESDGSWSTTEITIVSRAEIIFTLCGCVHAFREKKWD